jgi:dTDP-4-dehydrorhamnose 3,5-epimerase
MIEGVVTKELTTYSDERGFFREIIRVTDDFFSDGFGQWSHSMVQPGVAKAWHVHKLQTDWFYVVTGSMKVVLHDTRPDSPTHGETMQILMGDHYPSQVVKIPPGVAHGYKVIDGPAHMLYLTSRTYDPGDEGRIPHDDPTIGYDWSAGPTIK